MKFSFKFFKYSSKIVYIFVLTLNFLRREVQISGYPSVYSDTRQFIRISGSLSEYPAVYPDIRLYIRRNPASNYIIYFLQYAVQIHPYLDLVKLR